MVTLICPTGNELKAARALLGLTLAEVAPQAGVSIPTISRRERRGAEVVYPPNADTVIEFYRRAGIEFTPYGPRRVA